jgi:hypothetical protein
MLNFSDSFKIDLHKIFFGEKVNTFEMPKIDLNEIFFSNKFPINLTNIEKETFFEPSKMSFFYQKMSERFDVNSKFIEHNTD